MLAFKSLSTNLFLILITGLVSLQAQWSNAIVQPIASNDLAKKVSNQSMVIDENDQLHIIWQQDNGGILELWYNTRKANGDWSTALQINDQAETFQEPKMVLTTNEDNEPQIYISYYRPVGNINQLFITTLDSEGQAEYQITNSPTTIFSPNITLDHQGSAHLAWVAENEEGKYRVYYTNTLHLENPEIEQEIDELAFSLIDNPLKTNLSIGVDQEGYVHIAFVGPVGPSGHRTQYIVQDIIGGNLLWNYSFFAQSLNEADSTCVMQVKDDQVHLVFAGNDGPGTPTRVFYLSKMLEDLNWTTNVLIYNDGYTLPEAMYLQEESVHLTLNKNGNELIYTNNSQIFWNSETLLGTYPVYHSSLTFDSYGNGFVLAEQGSTTNEQVVLWGVSASEWISGLEGNPGDLTESWTIGPNPAKDVAYLDCRGLSSQENDIQVSVYNSQGQIMQSFPLENEQEQINTSTWPQGIYLIQLQSPSKTTTQKLIKS